jgi:hypothetical protein
MSLSNVMGGVVILLFVGFMVLCSVDMVADIRENAKRHREMVEKLPMFLTVDGIKYQSVDKSAMITNNGYIYFKLAE